MTLIVTRTSCCYALMVTDRKVTKNGTEYDPDANKNLLFSARNAVIAIGYTGMAYIGTIPTDQWIAQTLTDLTFPEGRHGKGSIPAKMTFDYEEQYIYLHVRNLMDRLNEVRPLIIKKYRRGWSANSFDLLMTGFEWNHDMVRPFFRVLSKPPGSDKFELSDFDRHIYLPQGKRYPVRMYAAPAQNLSTDELGNIHSRLDSVWGDGHGTTNDRADHAMSLIAETIQDMSERLNVVGPDIMSILIPHPRMPNPTIWICYIPARRNQGVLVAGGKQTPVPIAFSPWVVRPRHIQPPCVFTSCSPELPFGRYRVVMKGLHINNIPGVISSQQRREIQ